MSDPVIHLNPRDEPEDETREHQEQLAKRDAEILRLRDLLISKDIELGATKGRLAELELHSARLVVLAQHLQLRIPGAARFVGGLRLLTRRRRRAGG